MSPRLRPGSVFRGAQSSGAIDNVRSLGEPKPQRRLNKGPAPAVDDFDRQEYPEFDGQRFYVQELWGYRDVGYWRAGVTVAVYDRANCHRAVGLFNSETANTWGKAPVEVQAHRARQKAIELCRELNAKDAADE